MIDLYPDYKIVFWIAAFVIPVILCGWHYIFFSLKSEKERPNGLVRRFNGREMVTHWLRIILMGILIYSGVSLVLGQQGHIGFVHGYTGLILAVVIIADLFWWSKDSLFKGYDIIWLRNMGGYLSKEPVEAPAGRFNAGQKIFFWSSTLLVIALAVSGVVWHEAKDAGDITVSITALSVHGLLGCLMTALVIGHAYLSLLANPLTARVLLDGKCSRAYVEKHHPLWNFIDDRVQDR